MDFKWYQVYSKARLVLLGFHILVFLQYVSAKLKRGGLNRGLPDWFACLDTHGVCLGFFFFFNQLCFCHTNMQICMIYAVTSCGYSHDISVFTFCHGLFLINSYLTIFRAEDIWKYFVSRFVAFDRIILLYIKFDLSNLFVI